MHKISPFSLILLSALTLTSCNDGVHSLPHIVKPKDIKATTLNGDFKTIREKSIIGDGYLRNGFALCGRTNGSGYEGLLNPMDYNKQAETTYVKNETRFLDSYYWTISQWWTAYSLDKATYSYEDYSHVYNDTSHHLAFNTNNGTFSMRLNAYIESISEYGRTILKQGNWSHLLLEQFFPISNRLSLKDIKDNNIECHVKMDFTLNRCDWYGTDKPIEGQAAQYLLTFILGDPNGRSEKWMWFQLPIFDSRFDTIADYHAGDSGQPGASNMYVYGVHSKEYMPKYRLKAGETHCFDFDFSKYLDIAYQEAKDKGYLKNTNYEDIKLWYLNMGFEMPNAGKTDCGYDIQVTVDNFDVYTNK